MWRRFWNGTSKEGFKKCELKILQEAGIEKFRIEDVYINETEFLHTIIVGEGPALVLIPGFGATVLFWYKLLKELSRHYTVYGVDPLGMGASARPKFNSPNRSDCENFFMDSLEAWRSEIKLEHFHLVGHSFGGYLSAEYTSRYPTRVRTLILVSPLATTKPPAGYNLKGRVAKMKCPKRGIFQTVTCCWERGYTPFSLVRGVGRLGKYALRVWSRNMLVSLTKEECEMIEEYCHQYLTLPPSGEYAMSHIMDPPAWGYHPIDEKIAETPNWQSPVHFIYGQKDWMNMNSFGAQKMLDDGLMKGEMHWVPRGTHHPYFDNPTATLEIILKILG